MMPPKLFTLKRLGLLAMLALVQTALVQQKPAFNNLQAVEAAADPEIPFSPNADHPTQRPANRDQTAAPYENGRVVVGADERLPVLTRAFPWSAIGRLELQDASGQTLTICTATLIDADLILTNAHCLRQPVLNSETSEVDTLFVSAERYQQQQTLPSASKLVFKPSMIDGVSLDEATVITYRSGWAEGSTNSPAEDWAVLQLDTPLGNDYGSLGWYSLDLNDADTTAYLAENSLLIGYSSDFPTADLSVFGAPSTTAGADIQCSIVGLFPEGLFADTFIHDCDATPGSSGGPILTQMSDGNFYIIGLNAYQTPLVDAYTLPDGTVTRDINAGVQVSRWSSTAFEMLTP